MGQENRSGLLLVLVTEYRLVHSLWLRGFKQYLILPPEERVGGDMQNKRNLDLIPFNDVSRRYISYSVGELEELFASFIRSGKYLGGRNTELFQKNLSNFLGVKHCLGVASGTAALELALASLQLPENSRVLLAANAGGYGTIAVRNNNLKPVYADVNQNGLLDYETLKRSLDNVRAVIVTHLYGQSVELNTISDYLKKQNIFLIEDCAQAFGAKINGNRIGSFGDLSVFSFYPTKNLGSIGDAGAVCTNNSKFFDTLKKLAEYGWSKKYYAQIPRGSNKRIDEIQSIMLNYQLNQVDHWNARRREIWERYHEAAKDSGIRILGSKSDSFVAHLGVVVCSNRDRLMHRFKVASIETAIHYPFPDYLQPGLAQNEDWAELQTTQDLCSSVVSIPLFPELRESEIQRIEKVLSTFEE